MLSWVGKRPLTSVKAYPAQHIERFAVEADGFENSEAYQQDWPEKFEHGGLLFHGDNKDVLAHLLANGFRGKVKLIYIDPPFDSGADYVRKVQLRGTKGTTKVDGEEYTLGEQIQYEDIWANDNYLQFMYERLLMLKELLTDDGCIYLHCDGRKSHQLRCLLDEVFGYEKFQNEITWVRTSSHNDTSGRYSRVKDVIHYYRNGEKATFNTQYLKYDDSYIDAEWNKLDSGMYWKSENMLDPRGRMKEYDFHGTTARWRTSHEKMEKLWNDKQTDVPNSHGRIKLGKNGKPIKRCRIIFLDEVLGVKLNDNWSDVSYIAGGAKESKGYPTQKPEKLIDRLVSVSSNVSDIVLDCYIGSGTTASVAQKLGRRWIGCDINKGAIQTTAKRLFKVMSEQAAAIEDNKQGSLVAEENESPIPAQLSFNSYRVNDYDLQIQHNEAVQLACEHIGITRKRTDSYFDGTLGNKLAKIIPFNHPLSPLDLEDLRKELERRPEEERDITVVCLGLELKARAWVEDYNRNRPINKLHIIELRTDRKYGGFIKHEPLVASITVKRLKDKLKVTVNDVYSPSIVQRLNMDDGIFRAQIDDWRAVVDCIMIDVNYDGETFNVALSDVPPRKQDLVEGVYELAPPAKNATVAVKIIDMLGEEIIIVE